jgi:hypothetical protein
MSKRPATTPESPWVVYDYEVEMFTELRKVDLAIYPKVIVNAIVESMLLHLRILVEILISKGYPDDIKLKDHLLPKFESRLVDELRAKYGDGKREGTPCWTLNKRLAHPSLSRSSSHDYTPVVDALVPCILPLLDEIDRAREPSTRAISRP